MVCTVQHNEAQGAFSRPRHGGPASAVLNRAIVPLHPGGRGRAPCRARSPDDRCGRGRPQKSTAFDRATVLSAAMVRGEPGETTTCQPLRLALRCFDDAVPEAASEEATSKRFRGVALGLGCSEYRQRSRQGIRLRHRQGSHPGYTRVRRLPPRTNPKHPASGAGSATREIRGPPSLEDSQIEDFHKHAKIVDLAEAGCEDPSDKEGG